MMGLTAWNDCAQLCCCLQYKSELSVKNKGIEFLNAISVPTLDMMSLKSAGPPPSVEGARYCCMYVNHTRQLMNEATDPEYILPDDPYFGRMLDSDPYSI